MSDGFAGTVLVVGGILMLAGAGAAWGVGGALFAVGLWIVLTVLAELTR